MLRAVAILASSLPAGHPDLETAKKNYAAMASENQD